MIDLVIGTLLVGAGFCFGMHVAGKQARCLTAKLQSVTKQRDLWIEDARTYADNAQYWRMKALDAEVGE